MRREKERRIKEERSGWRRSKRMLMMFLKHEDFVEYSGDLKAEKSVKTMFKEREIRRSKRRSRKRIHPRT